MEEYDANTVARVAETLLSRTESLEDSSAIEDLLHEDTVVDPDVYSPHLDDRIRAECKRLAVICALLKSFARDSVYSFNGVVTSGATEGAQALVGSRIELIEHGRTDFDAVPLSPNRFEGRLYLTNRFDQYVRQLDEVDLWESAESNDDIRQSIGVGISKMRAERGVNSQFVQIITGFRVNTRFWPLASERGILRNRARIRRILRAVVETLEGINLAATHQIRKGPGPEEPSLRRGDDFAWRRDVDEDVHLHYWSCADGVIELACVSVTHDDCWIPE